MAGKEILVVEDEELTLNILTKMLTSLGYTVSGARNGKEALELFEEKFFLVVLTDIGMPLLDGNELISRLNKRELKPVILVQTGHSELDQVIDTMRRGVFDYIIKPVEISDIAFKLERAFTIAEMLKSSYIIQNEKMLRLEQQLQWLQWNEGIIKRDYDRIDQALFRNLHTSFNQGAGFGTLLTLIQLISSSAKEQEDGYVIDKSLFKAVSESADIALNTIDTFSEIYNTISREFISERTSLHELHDIIRNTVSSIAEYTHVRNHIISISDEKTGFQDIYISLEKSYFEKALKELLINALKFSKAGSKIIIILDYTSQGMNLSILNEPDKNEKNITGIPMEYSTIIFEPFFRMVSNVYEQYDTIDYGLGLTLVEKIIEKHNGKITAFNIQDNTDLSKGAVTKVNFSITIPLV